MGSCTCPDGFVYSVAGVFDDDNTDECGRGLACEGGVQGDCGPDVAANWTRKKVVCGERVIVHSYNGSVGTRATCAETNATFDDQDGNNVLITYSENTTVLSTHGGFCTCPDGFVYSVAGVFDDDNTDECGRGLACDGGVPGVCGPDVAANWTRKKVVCGERVIVHSYNGSVGTRATCAETNATFDDQDGNNVLITYSQNTTVLSTHGGFCTCPDGFVYSVAGVFDDDNTDECGRGLACDGGVSGDCGPDVAANWTRKKVVCGRSKTIHVPWPVSNGTKATCAETRSDQDGNNVLITYSENTTVLSTHGGFCTCPDGFVYSVAGVFDDGNTDECGRGLACEGGVPGVCGPDVAANWTRKKVVCGRSKTIHIPWPTPNGTKATCNEKNATQHGNNVIVTYSGNTTLLSTAGGICRCPDGQSYAVAGRFGDSGEDAPCGGGLACHGGTVAQNCSADRSTLTNWTRKEVFCGKRVTIHNYTGSVGTQATCAKTNALSDGDNLIVIHSGIGTWTQPKLKPDHACAYKMGDVNKTSPSLARCKSECVNDTKCLSIEWYSVASLCSLSYSNAASIFANTVGPSCEYHEYDRPALSASSGTCECSNGAIYTVSGLFNVSSGDPCGGGLACDFGIAGQCNPQRNLSSSRRRVICGQEKNDSWKQ